MKTKIKIETFRGKEILQIWELDQDGKLPTDTRIRPVVQMGIKKLKAIADNIDEVNDFIDRNDI